MENERLDKIVKGEKDNNGNIKNDNEIENKINKNENDNEIAKNENHIEKESKKDNNENIRIIITNDGQKNYKIINMISQTENFITTKVVDLQSGVYLTKLTLTPNESLIKKNIANMTCYEFDLLNNVTHPCLCKAIYIDTFETLDFDGNNENNNSNSNDNNNNNNDNNNNNNDNNNNNNENDSDSNELVSEVYANLAPILNDASKIAGERVEREETEQDVRTRLVTLYPYSKSKICITNSSAEMLWEFVAQKGPIPFMVRAKPNAMNCQAIGDEAEFLITDIEADITQQAEGKSTQDRNEQVQSTQEENKQKQNNQIDKTQEEDGQTENKQEGNNQIENRQAQND